MKTAITIRPVASRQERNIFLVFPWRIYADDPIWVPPLLPERREAIDPRRGAFFKRGEAEMFLAWRGSEPVATLALGVDHATNAQWGRNEAIFGFLDLHDDYSIAQTVFDFCAGWTRERGLTAMRGPFNLDYENGYGVLIEGRERQPALLCGHTPPYYQGFYERYGFVPARGDNLAYAFDLQKDTPRTEELARMADRIRARGRFTIRGADLVHWQDEVDRVHRLLNTALAHLPDHVGWQRSAVEATVAPFRKLADPELILFAEADGECIAWFPGIPNLNEHFAKVNGLRKPWDYLHLLWLMRQPTACLAIKSVLVLPEYWGSGVAVLLFDEMVKRARSRGYRWADLSLTSEDNPKTPQLAQRFGAELYKRYRVYRLDL